jgi:hypothetical protein
MQREHLLTVQSSTTIHPPNKDVFLSPWYIGVGDGLVFSTEMESLLLPQEAFLQEKFNISIRICATSKQRSSVDEVRA